MISTLSFLYMYILTHKHWDVVLLIWDFEYSSDRKCSIGRRRVE